MADDQTACPACAHQHDEGDCDCGCEYDTSFCGRCGWLDCECPDRSNLPAQDGPSCMTRSGDERHDRCVLTACSCGGGVSLIAAFETAFGPQDWDQPTTNPGADDGPDVDPFGADNTALDRRALDRTTEVFGG